MMEKKQQKWGVIRETAKDAEKAGLDKDTGLCRTGLEEYLAVIFLYFQGKNGFMTNLVWSRIKKDI